MAYVLKKQHVRCKWCHLYFKEGDQLEIDHRIPRVLGGTEGYSNLQLLHRHCHDQKTAADGSSTTRSTPDKPRTEGCTENVRRFCMYTVSIMSWSRGEFHLSRGTL